jgi:membrane-anchored protein YejM (alkaline phosphatase superfamily)
MTLGDLFKIIVAIVTSGAFFGFAQFFITRRDNKKNIEKKLDDIDKKLDERIDVVDQKIDKVAESVDQNAAVLARTHILRFSDEIKNGMIHSSEYWRQQLDDCDTYQRFCDTHPNFKNSYTEHADKHIKEIYDKLKRKGEI